MRLCSVPGCDRPHLAHGLCAAHYGRSRRSRGLQPDVPVRSQEERIHSVISTLAAIEDYIAMEHWSPSVREICASTGIASTATVARHLSALEAVGLIERKQDRSRQIRIPRRDR